jgi:mRNA-degrading endonuclease YafQ of YafQ-DinJ toxin-antitoxin module
MKVKEIRYNEAFKKQFGGLSLDVRKKACKAEKLFRENPFHPSLRLHKLKGKLVGLWSISIDRKNRIVFKPLENGVILFVSAGMHAIYDKMT